MFALCLSKRDRVSAFDFAIPFEHDQRVSDEPVERRVDRLGLTWGQLGGLVRQK